MNKLFVFGDSYSADFNLGSEKYRDYYNFLNGEPFPDTWPTILSKKLDLKLETIGINGASNYTIFQEFCKNSYKIKENDVVIIGWSFLERFILYDEINNKFKDILPGNKDGFKIKNINDRTVDEMFFNRSNDYWLKEIQSWEILIKTIQSLINFKLIIWSFDVRHNETKCFNLHDELVKMGAKTIQQETDYLVSDTHYGKTGHIKQSEYFYEKISNIDSTNFIKL